MEYQFRRDLIGRPEARFNMNYEAMAVWLTEEIGTRQHQLNKLFEIIAQLKNSERWEYELEGEDYHLVMNRQEAIVRAGLMDTEMDCDEMEDMDYYDSESQCQCGLDDFNVMLISWQEFISE